jgi:hypothetical protein
LKKCGGGWLRRVCSAHCRFWRRNFTTFFAEGIDKTIFHTSSEVPAGKQLMARTPQRCCRVSLRLNGKDAMSQYWLVPITDAPRMVAAWAG